MFGYRIPKDFLLGTASSAFQTEGAVDRDGKSESIMDHYAGEREVRAKQSALKTAEKTGQPPKYYTPILPDPGCFFYDNYEAYIEDMQKTGQNTFRMSLSWPRIIPTGVGEVNPKAIDYYNRVINKLLSCGITPFVDLYHWDLPQCLMDKGGFLSPEFPEWFEAYAKVCFEAFGDRVKLWSTFNESDITVGNGYINNRFAPYHEDIREGLLAGQRCLIAHFRAVRLYKSMNLGGQIGAVNCMGAIAPAEPCEEDMGAVARQVERHFDWWTQVMLEGTYPQRILRECPAYREAMPEGYQEELDKWFIPMDFVGVNYYMAHRTRYNPEKKLLSEAAESFYAAPGQSYAPYPPGLFDVVLYISQRYNNIPIYITENGCCLPNVNDEEKECDDPERVTYLREHLRMVSRLLKVGVNLKGYYYWNDADCNEGVGNYRLRFGLTWVDHKTGRRRWKKSRHYFSQICKNRIVN